MKLQKLRLWSLPSMDALVARIHWFFSEERHDPYRCSQCGSTHIKRRAWIYPNQGNKYDADCEDLKEDQDWCEDCDGYTHARCTSYLLHDAEQWWKFAEGVAKEDITGISFDDFCIGSSDDELQKADSLFVAACQKWWEQKSLEEKIKIWINYK